MKAKTTFNNIQIGRKFKTNTGIVYTKISEREARPVKDSKGATIKNKNVVTPFFYNSPTQVEPL